MLRISTFWRNANFVKSVELRLYYNSASEMTYIVSSGALNSTHSLTVLQKR